MIGRSVEYTNDSIIGAQSLIWPTTSYLKTSVIVWYALSIIRGRRLVSGVRIIERANLLLSLVVELRRLRRRAAVRPLHRQRSGRR